MKETEPKLVVTINRELIDQVDFDELYGYVKPKRNIRGEISKLTTKFDKADCMNVLMGLVPILTWLPAYRKGYIIPDIVAGLTVGVLCVPQAMAYAALANLNAVIGLYSSFFPTLTYAVFGTSKHISLGMFAVISLMVGNAVEREVLSHTLNQTDPSISPVIPGEHPEVVLVATLTFLVGIVMTVMSLMQLHFVTTYLSEPLVSGFTSASACHVLMSQLPKLLGLKPTSRHGLFKLPLMASDFIMALPHANVVDGVVSVLCIGILMSGKLYLNPPIQRRFLIPVPFELLVMIIGILVSYFLDLNGNYGVAIVGDIPRSLPTPSLPMFSLFGRLIIDAILIAVVTFSVTVSVGKVLAKKHNYHIIASQELRALAICQFIGGFMSCHPASGGLARSAVNSSLGGVTQISSCTTALVVLVVILLAGPLLYDLPMSILSSIIVVALQNMLKQVMDTKRLWKVSKMDLMIWLVSFLSTALWNVSEGLGIAIVFAIITVIIRTQWPRAVMLGRMGNTELYKDTTRYEIAEIADNIAIYRYDAPLLFLNSDAFKDEAIHAVQKQLKDHDDIEQKFLIVDASGFTFIDYMGVEALKDLYLECAKRRVQMLIASPKATTREMLATSNAYDVISAHYLFPSIIDASLFARGHRPPGDVQNGIAVPLTSSPKELCLELELKSEHTQQDEAISVRKRRGSCPSKFTSSS